MTKPIQVTVILPLLLAISFSRNDDIHSSISGINLNPGHYHCHHINPKLPTKQINKVQNLAWVCENCHKAIHGKAAPSYAVGQVKDKIERFQKQL